MTTLVCPSCGNATPSGFPRCANCGGPLEQAPPPREERKVVTVLFCDLVGSTAQAERLDPEDVRALLSRYHARVRAELERFGGTVEKFIGDAVMALFGAPVAHEDDPERAVRAALAVREALEGELSVRIGITTGEALVSLGARPEHGEGMAAGDVVNTAARLQAAAPVDGILVDETTYRATERAIEYREAQPVEAKGKDEPIHVWEAVQARSRFGTDVRQIGRTPLVGREHELDVLADALARTQREREPQLVTLVGVPGIGKSRLVWEVLQRIDAERGLVRWRQGRSLPYGDGMSFWALGEMVKAEAGILETDADEKAAAKLDEAVRALAVEDAAWVAGHLRPLVGVEATASVGSDGRPEAFAAWRRFVEALAEQRPTVLVFEDLHWADEGLLDFVDHLVEWVSGAPLLVVATARPELLARRPNWGGGKPNATTLSLSPLSTDETARLVHALLETSALDAEAQSTLLERTGGNPLYAEEFVRLVEERRADTALPESVQGIIAARLDALPVEEKALLQDAAVLGKVFWLGGLGRERWRAEELLHALERKEFIRRERRSSLAGESEYAFRHALVRDVAYDQIPRAQRAERHHRAAEWVESFGRRDDHAEMLAHHYLAALEFARAAGGATGELEERVRLVSRDAGDRAASLYAFGAAARHYERAVALWPESDPERPQLMLRYGEALASERSPDAERVLAEARDGLLAQGDPDAAAQAEAALGELLYELGEGARGSEHLERAIELVRDRPPTRARADAFVRAARFRTFSGRAEDGAAAAREALLAADELGLNELRARALHYLGSARLFLGDLEGIADIERSLALVTNPLEQVRIYNNLAGFNGYLGNVARERELYDAGSAAAERLGDPTFVRQFRFNRATILYRGGRWGDALALSDHLWIRISVAVARGDAEGVLEEAREAVHDARATGRRDIVAGALGDYAWVARAADRAADAGRAADELADLLAESTSPEWFYWAPLFAFVLEAHSRADALAEVLRRMPATPWFDAARLYISGAHERAADVLARLEHRPAEAYARLRASERLAAEGRWREADAQLERALAFWRSVGATAYIAAAERLRARVA